MSLNGYTITSDIRYEAYVGGGRLVKDSYPIKRIRGASDALVNGAGLWEKLETYTFEYREEHRDDDVAKLNERVSDLLNTQRYRVVTLKGRSTANTLQSNVISNDETATALDGNDLIEITKTYHTVNKTMSSPNVTGGYFVQSPSSLMMTADAIDDAFKIKEHLIQMLNKQKVAKYVNRAQKVFLRTGNEMEKYTHKEYLAKWEVYNMASVLWEGEGQPVIILSNGSSPITVPITNGKEIYYPAVRPKQIGTQGSTMLYRYIKATALDGNDLTEIPKTKAIGELNDDQNDYWSVIVDSDLEVYIICTFFGQVDYSQDFRTRVKRKLAKEDLSHVKYVVGSVIDFSFVPFVDGLPANAWDVRTLYKDRRVFTVPVGGDIPVIGVASTDDALFTYIFDHVDYSIVQNKDDLQSYAVLYQQKKIESVVATGSPQFEREVSAIDLVAIFHPDQQTVNPSIQEAIKLYLTYEKTAFCTKYEDRAFVCFDEEDIVPPVFLTSMPKMLLETSSMQLPNILGSQNTDRGITCTKMNKALIKVFADIVFNTDLFSFIRDREDNTRLYYMKTSALDSIFHVQNVDPTYINYQYDLYKRQTVHDDYERRVYYPSNFLFAIVDLRDSDDDTTVKTHVARIRTQETAAHYETLYKKGLVTLYRKFINEASLYHYMILVLPSRNGDDVPPQVLLQPVQGGAPDAVQNAVQGAVPDEAVQPAQIVA